ncbi:MAG: M1 family metallopeptidase [Anaerolineae bacterium]
MDLEAVTVSGHEEIGYRNTEGVTLHALYLRLFPNTPGYGGRMTVTNLSLDGQLVAPVTELESSALRVPLHPPLRPDARVRLTVDFTVALPTDRHPAESRVRGGGYRQLGYYEETVTLPNVYPVVPVYDEGWNVELAPAYGDAVFSDVAFFNVRISAPATMTLAASGTCAPYATHGGTKSWSCIAGPMRDFNAILREGYEVKSRGVRGITVNSVFYAEHEAGGSRALDYASRAVRLFDRGIGPYPFTELDVVETPTLAGGIEYPGLVVINSSYYEDGSTRMEWVVVHEVLHQWWYGLVGNDQVDEPWLDEALVQYCTLLYFQEYHGQAVADRLLETVFRQPYAELQETGRDQPVGLPVAAYSRGDYGPLIYQKGPLYFHDVRQAVGDEAFREILKTYFEGNRYGIATPDDWLTAVEAVAGRQYRDLFDGWIGAQ